MNTENVKIGTGYFDKGAWDRCIVIARHLEKIGAWNGQSALTINEAYDTHAKITLYDQPLIEGMDYELPDALSSAPRMVNRELIAVTAVCKRCGGQYDAIYSREHLEHAGIERIARYANGISECSVCFHHFRDVIDAPLGGGWGDAPIILALVTADSYACIVCGEPMDIIEQPALLPSREATTLVTCSNPDCPAFGYTYDARDLEGEPVEGDLPDATFDGVGCVAARTTATFATAAEYDEWTSQVAAAQPDPMPVLSWRCGKCDAQHESAYFRSRAICERCGHWNEWFEVVDPALIDALHTDYQARLFATAPLNGGAQ